MSQSVLETAGGAGWDSNSRPTDYEKYGVLHHARYLGDLADRGPASPAVLRLVTGTASSGRRPWRKMESAFVITSAGDPS
jgi:hypothetical protein